METDYLSVKAPRHGKVSFSHFGFSGILIGGRLVLGIFSRLLEVVWILSYFLQGNHGARRAVVSL